VHCVYGAQPVPATAPNELTQAVHALAPTGLLVPAGHSVHRLSLFAAGVNVLAAQSPHVWSAMVVPTAVTCLPAGQGVYPLHVVWFGAEVKPVVQSAQVWSVVALPTIDT